MNKNFDLKHFWSTLMTSAIFGAIGTGVFIMLEPHLIQAAPHPGPVIVIGNWNLFLVITAFLWFSMSVVLMIGERYPHARNGTQKDATQRRNGA